MAKLQQVEWLGYNIKSEGTKQLTKTTETIEI